jgi:general secretion pathway protein K
MSLTAKPCRAAEGFALVAVLLTIAVLSLIAASMLSTSRVASALSHYSAERARAAALAEAGINRAILALMDQRAEERWRVDGTPYKVVLLGATVTVRIQDELGKIDLNAADRQLLAGLFGSAGLGPQAIDSLVDKILDWRDSSGLKRLNGASDADYSAAGDPYHPRNGPFQRIDELLLVIGMTADLYRRVEPALTVYSGRPLIDPQVAAPEALRALAQVDQAQTDAMTASRGSQDAGNPSIVGKASSTQLPGVVDPSISLAGRAFSIRADITGSDGASAAVKAVIRLSGDPHRPYWVLSWEVQ